MFFIFIKVLRKIINVLPSVLSVSRVVVDFEKALWSALKSVLPEAVIMGCLSLDPSSVEEGKQSTINSFLTDTFNPTKMSLSLAYEQGE